MPVKAAIKDGRISFDLAEFVEGLGAEDRRTLARMLGAKRELFASVAECLGDDSRHGYYANDDDDGAWWFDTNFVLEAREKLLPLMPQIARHAVHQALVERNLAKEEARRMNEWAWKLYHAWPRGQEHARPDTIGWTDPPKVVPTVGALTDKGTP